jgi:hypothetical protein
MRTPSRPKTKAAAKPAAPAPRPIPESCLAGGKLWKMSGRHGVAYVRDAALAGELAQTDPKGLARAAMAVYYDRKGRAFAWQVRFDTDRWEELLKRLG